MRFFRIKTTAMGVASIVTLPIIMMGLQSSNNAPSVYAATIAPRLKDSQFLSQMNPNMQLALQFFLKPNHLHKLENLAQEVSNPQNRLYRHFLSSRAVESEFAPSDNAVNTVTTYLKQQGFTNIHVSQNHMVITGRATAQKISRMFHSEIGWYKNKATGEKFFSIDSPATIPTSLQSIVSQVYGLASNAFQISPVQHPQIQHSTAPQNLPTFSGTVEANATASDIPVGQPVVVNVTVSNASGPVSGAEINNAMIISGPANGTIVSVGPTGPNVIGGNGLSWTTNANGQAQIFLRLSAPGTYSIAPVIDINGTSYLGNSFSITVSGSGSLWNLNGNYYGYIPSQINRAYNALPVIQEGQGGQGITIANIIEGVPTNTNPWGQNWTWTSDLLNYAEMVHQPVNFPQVIPVSGGASAFHYSQGWTGEGELDIERLMSAAPRATLLLYDAYTNPGLFSAVNTAIEQDRAQIVTMSWGGPSSPQGLFAMGVVQGMTFFAASGDSGPYANSPSLVMSMYPANSLNVTGVGGTELALGSQGQILSQGAWSPEGNRAGVPNASSGGFSPYVPEPTWQEPYQSTGYRGTPDVSLMSAFGWYVSYIEGSPSGAGGTSAASPTWAGYLADVEAADHISDLGNINPLLYQLSSSPETPFQPINYGGNAWLTPWNPNPPGYAAQGTWSPVTGLGTPNVQVLAEDIGKSVAPIPSISAVTPNSAPPGAIVRITGKNFGASRGTVTVGDQSATLMFWTNDQIVVKVPPVPSGIQPLVVTTALQQQVEDSQFTVLSGPAPIIRTVFPNPAAVGQTIRLYGEYFGNSPGSVTIGGQPASINEWSPFVISVTVPSVAPGPEQLTVSTAAGQTVNDNNFEVAPPPTPTIRSVFPEPAQVGQTIRIFGTDFGNSKGTVTVGGQPASIVTWTPYFIEVVVPSVPPGVEPLVVTSTNGQSGTYAAFTVSPPPTPVIRTVYPNPAKPGSIVYISGMDFGLSPGQVALGNLSITVRSWSPYFVSFQIPSSMSPGTYGLTLTTNTGQKTMATIEIS
ncbi:protease pro-enzyme activation domain-containing protein [Sulfobacillus thermosulfidooxidans]|uniref:protease pro-enzyme activation domain-containing protein n=1 Tax=Sulfobacillus thermosulfidooxidans TaxID=28034 RepID=UPI0002E8EE41|nr:protease pro-enzyme activation domain-containing protein [Sulfobacillus thermosulfidooxidans]